MVVCLLASLVVASASAHAQPVPKSGDDPQARNGAPTRFTLVQADDDDGVDPVLLAPERSYLDTELAAALHRAGVLDEWFDASAVAAESSLIALEPNASYDAGRDELFASLNELADVQNVATRAVERLSLVTTEVQELDDLLRSVIQDIAAHQREGSEALAPIETAEAEVAAASLMFGTNLESDSGTAPTTRIARDARDLLLGQLAALKRNPALSAKAAQRVLAAMQTAREDLGSTQAFLEFADKIAQRRQRAADRLREIVVDQIPDLHAQRRTAPTLVDGLPLVTVDAYVQGAARVSPSCPVDWALLAGVGRIESRHGTVDDSQVLSSGNVTVRILGPLLDGGATEREAAEELRAAEEAAALELQLLEEERLAEEAAFAALQAEVYGLEIAEEPESDEEEPEPQFDVLGWPIEEETDQEIDDGEGENGEDDEEEPELLGNGFAVIEDSDNGRLDGNDRWDRAVGPMQFIPETWSFMQVDGNDDGVRDPQNLFDAAATAAEFLCLLSNSRGAAPERFVLGYNGSTSYVDSVLTFAAGYRSKSLSIDWLVAP